MNQLLFDIAIAGPTLFIGTALVFGFFKPGYSQLRLTISEGALGKFGWVQTVNFVVNGLLITLLGLLLFAKGGNTYSAGGITTLGLILFFSAIFPTDPVAETKKFSPTGLIHNLLFLVGMLGILSGEVVAGLNQANPTLGVISWVAFVLTLTGLIAFLAMRQLPGLPQRLMVAVIMTWVTVFALL